MSAIECRDVSVAYRRVPVVSRLALTVAPGEHVALFGGPGAGKSTILGALAGVLPVDGGSVSILGRSPAVARSEVAYVASPLDARPGGTVAAAILRTLSACRASGAQRVARAAEVTELLGMEGWEDRPVRELSHGGRVAAALACALAPHPPVLLLDNVLADLPPPQVNRVFRHLTDRRSLDGLAVVHATTSSSEAERADRVLVLESGQCLADGAPADLIAQFAAEAVTVEAEDARAVRRTLRGMFDVEISVSDRELRFTASDGASVAAHLFRHPEGGVRAVCVRRGDLWDVLARLRAAPG